MTVSHDRDRVYLGLTGRRRDVLLDCGAAEELVDQLRRRADLAAREPKRLHTEAWGCRVESYDGFVALRFTPPCVGAIDRVPLSPDAARQLADLVEFKSQQARYKMRFAFA